MWLWALLSWVCSVPSAVAHQASDSYLSLTWTNQTWVGRLDLAIRDLDAVFGLDLDVNGSVTWGELKAGEPDLADYVLTNVTFVADGRSLVPPALELMVDDHDGAGFAVWSFVLPLKEVPKNLDVRYVCIFEVDALHRAFVKVDREGTISTAMLSPAENTHRFEFPAGAGSEAGVSDRSAGFVREGVFHIWTGYDHVLFLLALLIPAVLQRSDGRWQPVPALRPAFWSVFKTVTAFTVAHSITLTLAAFGLIHLSPRLVEPIIAASVVLAAANNLYPVFHERGWIVAFAFGLIHGFGFAGVLEGLDLSGMSLAWPLLGFNLGVELGQAAIVLLFVPLAFALRHTGWYRWIGLRLGSAAIVLLASIWFVQRVTGGP
ncbi:MAG: HupE/UreJ family protein [Verrucomicrobiales bacterium]|nr:HupE/UreJ family protein [Verrucomicrobiales bacterium]